LSKLSADPPGCASLREFHGFHVLEASETSYKGNHNHTTSTLESTLVKTVFKKPASIYSAYPANLPPVCGF